MALSGRINGSVTARDEKYDYYITWEASQSVTGNYSDVTVKSWWSTPNTAYTWSTSGGLRAYSITINGDTTSGSQAYKLNPWPSNPYLIQTKTTRVYHNNDGTAAISISARSNGYAASYGPSSSNTTAADCTASGTIYLDTIPRASSCSFPTMAMGTSNNITISAADSSFTHTLWWYFGTESGRIGNERRTERTIAWTPPLTLGSQIPANTSGVGNIVLITFNSGGTEIGRKTIPLYLTIGDSYKPTIAASNVSTSIATYTTMGVYVQGKSAVTVALSASTTNAYGATVASWSTVINGVTYSGQNFTTGVLSKDGTMSITTTITDTRGRVSTVSGTQPSITVVPYYTPKITTFSAVRNATTQSTINCSYGFDIASVSSKNSKTLSYRSRIAGGTWTGYTSITISAYSGTGTFNITGTSTDASYEVELKVGDTFTTTAKAVSVSTAFVTMDFKKGGKGVAFGKVSETDNLLDVSMNMTLAGGLTLPRSAGSWISGMTNTKCFIAPPTEPSSYQPVIRMSTSTGNVFNLGGLGESIGFHGYFKGRTDNATDWRTVWDMNTGRLWHTGGASIDGELSVSSELNFTSTNEKRLRFNNCSTLDADVAFYGAANNSVNIFGLWDYSDGKAVFVYSTNKNIYFARPMWAEAGLNTIHMNCISTGNNYIELRSTDGGTPFLDFSRNSSADYHGRIIINSSNEFDCLASGFRIHTTMYANSKAAITNTSSFGEITTYCDESPNHVFNERGRATLDEDGYCYVFVDQIFKETVNTDNLNYWVQLTGIGTSDVYIHEYHSDYFTVKGEPNKEFNWQLTAERLGAEHLRFNEGLGVFEDDMEIERLNMGIDKKKEVGENASQNSQL